MLEIVLVTAMVLVAVMLALFVTYLYVRRLQAGEKGPKSFFRWIKDLIDVVLGL